MTNPIVAQKRCPRCTTFKPTTDFYSNKGRKDGLATQCKNCHNEWARNNTARRIEYCKEYRSIIENKEKMNAYSREYSKTETFKEIQNRYKATEKHKETRWRYWLKLSYNITPEQFNQMMELQGGVCAICRKSCRTHARLSIDHNHTTGQVRGLLCRDCNSAIGLLKDSPDLIEKAKQYLLTQDGNYQSGGCKSS